MSITLVTVGVKNPKLTKFALEKTLKAIPKIDKVKVFSYENLGIGEHHFLPPKFSLHDYSVFVMKELNNYIDTDHVILGHYDGMGVNSEYWDDDFLNYDCIGSATHREYPPLKGLLEESNLTEKAEQSWYSLGGGFCIRSKRLLEAISNPEIDTVFYNHYYKINWSCEDISIGILYKKLLEDKYNIKFGSLENSIKFCSEILVGYSLGFHGWHLSPLFLTEQETLFYIDEYIKSVDIINIDLQKLKIFYGNCYHKSYDNVINYVKSVYKFL